MWSCGRFLKSPSGNCEFRDRGVDVPEFKSDLLESLVAGGLSSGNLAAGGFVIVLSTTRVLC